MQDVPDFESFPQIPGIRPGNGHPQPRPRPGLEPIPVFERSDSVTLQIEILQETYEELLDIIRANEWETDEGLRTILTTGLGYLDAKQRLESINSAAAAGSPDAARRINTLVND